MFLVSWRKHDIGGRTGHPPSSWRSQRAIFSRISTLSQMKTHFFSFGFHGPWDEHGHILSSSGAKSLPIFLTPVILNGGSKV